MSRLNSEKKLGAGRVVAVAIENNKTSQHAAKWAVDNLLPKDQCLYLIHVRQKAPSPDVTEAVGDMDSKELFDSFRVFCNRKSIQCKEVLLEDMDISKALTDSITTYSIELLVLGAPSRGGLVRFRTTDVPSSVSKAAPPFCTVYIISKGKISSVRSATAPLPPKPAAPARNQLQLQPHPQPQPPQPQLQQSQPIGSAERLLDLQPNRNYPPRPSPEKPTFGSGTRQFNLDDDDIISPFTRAGKSYEPSKLPDSDISFVSSGRPSVDRMFPTLYEDLDSSSGIAPGRFSYGSDYDVRSSFASSYSGSNMDDYSFSSQPRLSECTDDVELEMRRLKLELKQTMELYSSACKEAMTAKQKAMELQRWKAEEQKKLLEESRNGETSALALMEMEQEKIRSEALEKIAALEAQKGVVAAERKKPEEGFGVGHCTARYRRYSIEEIEEATNMFNNSLKIGEGGYGPVYRCELDCTQVAIKVLKPDAAHGREQFQQEVEVLSRIRHPNMVLLLGACPEYGCLVYEYMANGSLDDCLFRRGKRPPLPWQLRFQIAAEIATGLLFLHQTKPEPLVHRDLKPGNILLDRNYVSKISDVGLARLVPPSVADTVTQYRMTSTAGTFCYIDPEYQQTGMLGIKSDIYSLGVMLLQIVTAKPPMGLTHHVGKSIEKGTFADMLDPAVEDWPLEQTLHFAKLSLQCAEMRRKDRPDLGKVVLPELNKLRAFADQSMSSPMMVFGGYAPRSGNSRSYSSSTHQEDTSESSLSGFSGCESRSSTSSLSPGRM